jgi:hypothetical protein
MKAWCVTEDNVCFCDASRFKIASFLIPKANPLNNDNPLANKQWIKLVNDIDSLEIGKSLYFGQYTVALEEIENKVFLRLVD